jgi:hypothetical protein
MHWEQIVIKNRLLEELKSLKPFVLNTGVGLQGGPESFYFSLTRQFLQ